MFGLINIFVILILYGGLKTLTYYNDINNIKSIQTKRHGIIVDYDSQWPQDGTNWGKVNKSKSGFTLNILLDDGNKYGFDVDLSTLSRSINIGDEVSFYYSTKIYPNSTFNSFGLEKDGIQLSPKVSVELQKVYNESRWYSVFSLFVFVVYLYHNIRNLILLKKIGIKDFINEKYCSLR